MNTIPSIRTFPAPHTVYFRIFEQEQVYWSQKKTSLHLDYFTNSEYIVICENEYTNQAANCRKKIQRIASILSWTYPLRVHLDGVEFQYLEYYRVKGPVTCIHFIWWSGDAIL